MHVKCASGRLTSKSALMNDAATPVPRPRLRPAHASYLTPGTEPTCRCCNAPLVRCSKRDNTRHIKTNKSRNTESPTKPIVRPLRAAAQSSRRGSARQGASNTWPNATDRLQLATRPSSMGSSGLDLRLVSGEPCTVGSGVPSSVSTSCFRPLLSSTRNRMARSTSSAASGSRSPVCLERQLNASSDEDSVRARIGSLIGQSSSSERELAFPHITCELARCPMDRDKIDLLSIPWRR